MSIENWTPPTKARPWQRLQGLLAKTCLIAGKLQGCHSHASRGWRQLHLASVSRGGRGAASNVLSSGGVGRTVKTRPARRGPASDSSKAAESAWGRSCHKPGKQHAAIRGWCGGAGSLRILGRGLLSRQIGVARVPPTTSCSKSCAHRPGRRCYPHVARQE